MTAGPGRQASWLAKAFVACGIAVPDFTIIKHWIYRAGHLAARRFTMGSAALATHNMTELDNSLPGFVRRFDIAWVVLISIAVTALVYLPLYSGGGYAPSDGQYGMFFAKFEFWSDEYLGGWPAYADPTTMLLYPLRYLFTQTDNGFTAFVLLAPIIFAVGNGLLAREITRSSIAAFAVAAWSPAIGFLVSHLGHTSMIHAFCWAPWLMIGALRIGQGRGSRSTAAALVALAMGLSVLAGHPQLSLYALAMGAILAVPERWREYKQWSRSIALYAAGVVGGLLVASPLLVPALEFSRVTARAAINADTLSQFSSSIPTVLLNFVPYAAGGNWEAGARVPFTFYWTFEETVAYVGLSLAVLAAVGLVRTRLSPTVVKLVAIVAASFILAVAPSFARASNLLLWIPVFSDFRAWGRWLGMASLGLLQLAAIGLVTPRWRDTWFGRHPVTLGLLVSLGTVWLALIVLSLSGHAVSEPPVSRLLQGKIAWQIALAVACALLISVVGRASGARARSVLVGLIILIPVAELALLSRSAAWAHNHPRETGYNPSNFIDSLNVPRTGGRVLGASGWESSALSPDQTRRAGLSSINWYGPMLGNRVADLLGITSGGWVRPESLASHDQALDVFGVDLVEGYVSSMPVGDGRWPVLDATSLRLGRGCSESNPSHWAIEFQAALPIERIELASSMACGVDVPQGAPVAVQLARDSQGRSYSQPVEAGQDVGEWAAACLDPGIATKHDSSHPLVRIPNPSHPQQCAGSVFASRPFKPGQAIREYQIGVGAESGGFNVHGIRIGMGGREFYLPGSMLSSLNGARWRIVGSTDRGLMLQNTRSLPRFRFVDKAIVLDDAASLAALKYSRLPDGSAFDASTMAAVPSPVPVIAIDRSGPIRAEVSNGSMRIPVAPSPASRLLVVGDNYWPRWTASANGAKLDVMRVNYNQMGVIVPPGAAMVELRLTHRAFRFAVGTSVLASLVCLLLLIPFKRFARFQKAARA